MSKHNRKHFIAKHGLDAFELLPNFVWRIDRGPRDLSRRYAQVQPGDRWIAFAYTTSDYRERPLSLVTGFFECVKEACYRVVPKVVPIADYDWRRKGYAWMIEGKPYGKQPNQPVGVPPIDDLLGRSHFKNETLVPITAEEYEDIQVSTMERQFNTEKIPLIGREPECEQELLATVVQGHRELGIEKVLRVRKAFPDLLVKIEGKPQEVHLELEVYSQGFFLHGHHKQVRKRRFKEDGKPVAVLCWIDNNKDVKNYVHDVYELRSLIRKGKKIIW